MTTPEALTHTPADRDALAALLAEAAPGAGALARSPHGPKRNRAASVPR
jgi:hypothetical protein